MAWHGSNNRMMRAVFGGGIEASLASWKRDALAKVNAKIGYLRERLQDTEENVGQAGLMPEALADAAAMRMEGIAEGAASKLSGLAEDAHAMGLSQRAFQILHGLIRQPVSANAANSALLFGCLTLVEGLATGLFFLSGGFVSGIAEALGFGITISSLNILLSGFLGGGFFGKYWGYGLQSHENDPQLRMKRWAGRAGSIVTILMIITLLMASGIVRTTGETEGMTYDFETLGAAVTNFHALLLWGLGISFSVLSWRKGLSAFSDPYPGYTEASQAGASSQDDIQGLFAGTVAEIEEVAEDAMQDIDGMAADANETKQDLMDDLQELRHTREEILTMIAGIGDEYAAFRAEQIELQHMVQGTGRGRTESNQPPDNLEDGFDLATLQEQVPVINIDISALNAGFADARNTALQHLVTSKKSALHRLSTAYRSALR